MPSEPEFGQAQETAWIEVIRKMEEVYSDLIQYEIELEEKNAALEEAQRFINSVLSSVSDILVVCDDGGRIQQVNLAFLKLTDFAETDLIGRPLAQLLAGEGDGDTLAALMERASGGDGEMRFKASGGEPTEPVAVTCAVRYDHRGLPAGIVLSGRPVGELRRAYEALKVAQAQLVHQEKMASLGRLIAGVAHELNNPISFVVGNAHALTKYRTRLSIYLDAIHSGAPRAEIEALRASLRIDDLMADLPALVEGTLEGAGRVSDIVKSLKRLSFSSSGTAEPFDLAEVADKAVQWSARASHAQPVLAVNLEAPLPVRGHAGQIHQVLVNLIGNALDAVAGTTEPRVAITGRAEADRVVLVVEDNGPGIPEPHLLKVFDPFFTTKPVGQGTGLGLWISYGIVKEHGGDLAAGNGTLGGARFVMTLPKG